MEWITRLNGAINYIEEHLTDKVEYDELAKIACCSTYHLQRMFAYMADVPLSEYIRRRRMSRAAVDLQNNKIVDVALKYGYESPTAFNRAFQSVHGIAPSLIKSDGIQIRAFPPISFTITIKGAEKMEYRIEQKNSFRIVGISEQLEKEIEKNFEIVPKMWEKASVDGTIPKLVSMMDSQPIGMLGVCCSSENWKYFIAVSSSQSIDDTIEECQVRASIWAIFSGSGTAQSIQELQKRVLTEWLPTSGYEYGNAPDIEVYINPDPQNSQYEVWVPVIKK